MNLILFNPIAGSPAAMKTIAGEGWYVYLHQPGGVYEQIAWCENNDLEPRIMLHRVAGEDESTPDTMNLDTWPRAKEFGNTELVKGAAVALRELAKHCRLICYLGTMDRNEPFETLRKDWSKWDEITRLLYDALEPYDRIGGGVAFDHVTPQALSFLAPFILRWIYYRRHQVVLEPFQPVCDPNIGVWGKESLYQKMVSEGTLSPAKQLGEIIRFPFSAVAREQILAESRPILADGHTLCLRGKALLESGLTVEDFQ